MSLARASCSMCAGAGMLFFAATPFAPERRFAPGDFGPADASLATKASINPNMLSGACIEEQSCVDGYLWSVYERAPKTGFAWKDADAAGKAGLAPMDYVIGGMDPGFRVTLYRALRTLDIAGFKPGIVCGFRDDYRQSITSGRMKAQNDRSFHGGSFRGGYGHGMAADLMSVKGVTPEMFAWIDRHEKELGIGRPYLRRDPPHVAPIDGEEYGIHRSAPPQQRNGSKTRIRQPFAAAGDASKERSEAWNRPD